MPTTFTREQEFIAFLLGYACPSDVTTTTEAVGDYHIERRTFPIWLCCAKVNVVAEKVPILGAWELVSWELEQ